MIIHLGMNPDNGGRPPIDIRIRRRMIVINGILFDKCDRDRVVVVEL